jgi:alcohol dehydrogenase
VLGTGRDRALLERVRAICPERISVHSVHDEESVGEWARRLTGGEGANIVIDALFTGTSREPMLAAIGALRRGGVHVNVGGVTGDVPIDMFVAMNNNVEFVGSTWFSTAEGQEMADMAAVGQVDLSVFDHQVYKLSDVNTGLSVVRNRDGGFSNYVICP